MNVPGRAGTNAVVLIEKYHKTGSGLVPQVVVCAPKKLSLRKDCELLILDGSTDPLLYRELFPGEEIEVLDFCVERQGAFWQVSGQRTGSAHSYLKDDGGEANLSALVDLAKDVARLLGDKPLIGGQKQVIDALWKYDDLDGFKMLHHGAERGKNEHENRLGVIHAGREQLPLQAVELQARAFFAERPDLYPSQAQWSVAARRQRTPEGFSDPVLVHAHAEPLTQALLELKREGGTAQLLDRVRAVRAPRFLVALGNLPIDATATARLPFPTMREVMSQAAVAMVGLRARGYALVRPGRKNDRDVSALVLQAVREAWAVRAGIKLQNSNKNPIRLLELNRPVPVRVPTGGKGQPAKGFLLYVGELGEALAAAGMEYPGLRLDGPAPVVRQGAASPIVLWPTMRAEGRRVLPLAVAAE
jgi:hypothetical protein